MATLTFFFFGLGRNCFLVQVSFEGEPAVEDFIFFFFFLALVRSADGMVLVFSGVEVDPLISFLFFGVSGGFPVS